MNVDRGTIYIPLLIDQKRFVIKVEKENDPNDSDSIYIATGSDFLNLQESNSGFGMSIESAVETLLKSYGMPKKHYRMVFDDNTGSHRFEPINDDKNP